MVLLLVFLHLVHSSFLEDGNVLVLDDSTLGKAIEEFRFLLVEFYAPWCGHCKSLEPEYSKAAEKMKMLDSPVPLAKIDATANPEALAKYEIKGYPTIKFFDSGRGTDYRGERTEKEMIKWILKRVPPVIINCSSSETVSFFKDLNRAVAVFFGTKEDKGYSEFVGVSKGPADIPFILADYESDFKGISLLKDFDEKRNDFTGELTEEEIHSFVMTNTIPDLMVYDDNAGEAIFIKGSSALFVFDSTSKLDQYRTMLTNIGKEHKKDLITTYVDLTKPIAQTLITFFPIKLEETPRCIILESHTNYKYTLDASITTANLQEFLKKWKSKALFAYKKSQELPEESHINGVKIVVGKSFKELVLDDPSNVLIILYTNWSKPAKECLSLIERLSSELSGQITVCRLDSTFNDLVAHGLTGLPTIRFYPSHNKTGFIFKGERTYDNIKNFVLENLPGNMHTDL